MPALHLTVDTYAPDYRTIRQAVDILQKGGVCIIPTDSVYAFVADPRLSGAVDKLVKARGLKEQKTNFSFLCQDISQASEFTLPISRAVFKLMNRNLPGPFTFVLPASKATNKLFPFSRKEVGIRIPDHPVVMALLDQLAYPLMATSVVNMQDEVQTYFSDPEDLWERYSNTVDAIIDSGNGQQFATTVVDCLGAEPEVVREGIQPLKG